MPAAKVANLEKAAKAVKERETKLGPFIQVRAIARAQYGYPSAKLVDVGEVVRYYVKDLSKPRTGENPTTGLLWRTIEVNGKEYGLPSWAVDATDPVEDEDPDALVAAVSGRPVLRGGTDEDSDDVL